MRFWQVSIGVVAVVLLGLMACGCHGLQAQAAPPNTLEVMRCPPGLDWNSGSENITVVNGFTLDDGSGPADQLTVLRLCYNDTYLAVRYDCVDNNIHAPFTECNQDLYEADVVEMFVNMYDASNIASDNLHQYMELEVSPNNLLFASSVYNPDLTCAGIQGSLLPCNSTGIVYNAVMDPAEGSWYAELYVPFVEIAKVSNYSFESLDGVALRGNFFRIDTPEGQYTEYSCWRPTFSTPACFHKPGYFGYINLV